MAAYDDLNTKRIFTVGILSVVVTAVTALAVQVIYYSLLQWQHQYVMENSDYRRQNENLDAQMAEVSSYGVDPDTGKYTIPIEKSMELMLVSAKKAGANESKDEQPDAKKSETEKHDDKQSDSSDSLSL